MEAKTLYLCDARDVEQLAVYISRLQKAWFKLQYKEKQKSKFS